MNAAVGADERLVVMLEGRVSEFEKRMRQAERRGTTTYQGLRRNSRSATAAMERDMVRSTDRINQALAATSARIGTFGRTLGMGLFGGLAGGLAAGAVVSTVRSSIAGISETIGKAADRASIGTEALQGLQHGFELAGVSAGDLNGSLERFAQRAGEAANGAGPLQKVLDRYGVSVRDSNGAMKDQMTLLRDVSELIRRASSDQERASIAQAAFGNAGRAMVLAMKNGADGLDQMIEHAREGGFILEDSLVRKAEQLDDRFHELTKSVGMFGKRMAVTVADAVVELTDLRERLDGIFASESEGRAILGDEVFDALAANRDLVDENADALRQLDGQYVRLADEASAAGNAMRDAIGLLDSWGYDDIADALRVAQEEMTGLSHAFQDGEISGEDLAEQMTEIERRAQEALAGLDATDRAQFNNVISQLGRLGGVIASVTSLARSLTGALAETAGVSPGQQAMQAMRDRHAAEAASLDSLNAQRQATERFTAAENDRNSATAEQLRLQREIEATRLRAEEQGASLTAQQLEDAARASLAADDARRDLGRGAGSSSGGRASGGKAVGGAAKVDEFRQEAEAIRDRTRALEAEAVSIIAAAEGGREYGNALEFARTRAQLLHAAQQAGKQITPELAAEIDQLAESYMTAGLEAEAAADRMRRIEEQSARGRGAMEGFFGSILDGSKSAKDAFADLLAEFAKAQLMRGIFGLPGMGGIAGGIGGLLSPIPAFARGGQHSGGFRIVGESGPELEVTGPARYFSAAQTQQMLGGGAGGQQGGRHSNGPQNVHVSVSVDDNGNLQAFVDRRAQAHAGAAVRSYDQGLPQRVQAAMKYQRG